MLTENDEILIGLLESIKKDDVNAFRDFFYLYQPGVFNFLFRYTSDSDNAKDLTQEAFIGFWQNRQKIDSSRNAIAYLYKIARNFAINQSVKNLRTRRLEDEDSLIGNSKESTYAEYDRVFLMDAFQKAVEKLPERCRATFVLSRYSGFDYAEIAEIMGVSLQTVKNQMNKAISTLKKFLAEYIN
ncbi:MAG: RNA polymerase sigma-70 factor [Ignavibacteriales bacterium]|nr:RNA polymerase sigma-70 factor [Ignavibacteriales bacterium]MCF8306974.1 RNA polymerase sigma-70 factor [Ignavibacteriales bacterium]MCF8437414.1 RNA polymerase sigma-70 factor [Ignavibacteriales bacterium]